MHDCECLMSWSLRDSLDANPANLSIREVWRRHCLRDTLSLRDQLVTDFLVSAVIL